MPVSLAQARALAGLLIEAKLEELILDRNGLSNTSLAVICRAAQVPKKSSVGMHYPEAKAASDGCLVRSRGKNARSVVT